MANASVRLSYGGATRSQLLRARIFAEQANQQVDVITFDVFPEYDTERKSLQKEGLIHGGINLLNLHEELRQADSFGLDRFTNDEPIPSWYNELPNLDYVIENSADGSPYRRKYDATAQGKSFYFSYLRPDGTVYATVDRRIGGSDWDGEQRGTVLVAHNGQPIAFYSSKAKLIMRWIETLSDEQQDHFVIFDSKESGRLVVQEERSPNQHFILMAHTPHLQPPRRWDSKPASADWGATLEGLSLWDGVIVLSEAHKHDLELRYGARNNFFVVPHPAESISSPGSMDERQKDLAIIVCRLETQKRLQDAIRAFKIVVEERPSARLEIYGAGSKLEEWSALVRELGLTHAVIFRGYDPRPEAQYSRGSVFIMTSLFEAQPLTLLEAAAHGCPIVAYDIKYGPRELIRPGFNGFLSPEGDIESLAKNIVTVLSTDDVTGMSNASIEMAQTFSISRFVEKWASVFEQVSLQRSKRVAITSSRLTIQSIEAVENELGSLSIEPDEFNLAIASKMLTIVGEIVLSATTSEHTRSNLTVAIRAHAPNSDPIFLPSTLERLGTDKYQVSWTMASHQVPQKAELYYEVTWNNDQVMDRIPLDSSEKFSFKTISLVKEG